MIQFNLLPDVKLEFIRAQRMKRTVVGLALVASAVSLALFVSLFVIVNVVQKQHIENLTKDIETGVAKLQEIPEIDKVLTVQNQLSSLTALHEDKPASARTLTYLGQLTPSKASISDFSIDFETGVMSITGSADSLVTVNKFADTLKFTTYKIGESGESKPAFSEVVLTSFGVDDQGATYQLDFKFDPEIYKNTQEATLSVPNIISTRSQTEKPTDLFQATDAETSGEGQ